MSLYSHLEQIRMTNERIANLISRARIVADAFSGSEPEENFDRNLQKSGHALNNQFSEQINILQSQIDTFAYQLSRIENEVLDQGPPAVPTTATRVY